MHFNDVGSTFLLKCNGAFRAFYLFYPNVLTFFLIYRGLLVFHIENLLHAKIHLKGTSQLSYRVLVSCGLSLLILLATFCWPLAIAESKEKDRGSVKIVVNSLNVREKPGLTHPVIGYVQKNERFTILDLKDNWVQINLKSGYKGWIASWLVEFEQQTAVAAIPLLNVRSGPDISSSIIGQLNKGTSVVVLDQKVIGFK